MIQSIRLQHFRSYTDEPFTFSPSVNIIVGPNASGKTNLLEALLVVASGSSYRAHDLELIKHDESWARLDARVDGVTRTIKLVRDPAPEKTYELDGKTFKKLSLERSLPAVLFEPNHLQLLTGSPDRRRDYLDELLAQTTPGYGMALRHYRRALAQRNRLLKTGHPRDAELFPWDVRLSELGARLVRARHDLVETLAQDLPALYQELAQAGTPVAMHYHTGAAPEHYETIMLRHLEARHRDDIVRGFTSFGPHRDDLVVEFNGAPAEEVASRGETRTLVLALKILELQLLERIREQTPLLLLDDVFSELDATRRHALTTHLQPYQTFITTTDADVIGHYFADTSRIIPIGDQPNS